MDKPTNWSLLGRLAIAGFVACSRAATPTAAPKDPAADASGIEFGIDRAEDLRRAMDVPSQSQSSHDAAVRRHAACAFARILGSDDAPLLRALEDDDVDAVAWGGYGLGESCRGREEGHVRALAARLVSLEPARVSGRLDARSAIVRALGRCGGDLAEQTLRAWLRQAAAGPQPTLGEAAAYAFGDLVVKRGSLTTESAIVLLDAAEQTPPLDAALYPFGRIEGYAAADIEPRVIAAARAALSRPGPARIFAVRALGRTTRSDAASELARVLSSNDFAPAERAEAARALGRVHAAGQAALARALGTMLQGRSPDIDGDRFGVLLAAVTAFGDDPAKDAQPPLWAIARMDFGVDAGAAFARRTSALRCAAAQKLARGAWDSSILAACDVGDGEAGERARLAALDRGRLVDARRAAWLDLARQTRHVRVRESAIDSIARHPELGEAACAALAEALAATAPGVVATAAKVIASHPDWSCVAPDRDSRAHGPRASLPMATPVHEIDPRIAIALRAAMVRPWAQDLVETRAALTEAALAIGLNEALAFARAACREDNETLRERAARALAAAGDTTSCPRPEAPDQPAPEVGRPIARRTRVAFDTDAGRLGVSFDPTFAPVASTRFVALARSGFYIGIAFHRVVPGFAVQFGDRGGDGYGGDGRLLRCETSPVPFGALDVGVALTGRDTGSSQFFVALSRSPHLDGQYAWVGRADGDWNAVAEGDIVQAVRVEE